MSVGGVWLGKAGDEPGNRNFLRTDDSHIATQKAQPFMDREDDVSRIGPNADSRFVKPCVGVARQYAIPQHSQTCGPGCGGMSGQQHVLVGKDCARIASGVKLFTPRN